MNYAELAVAKIMVPLAGAEITATDTDGVVRWSLGLAAGVHEGRKLLQYASRGDLFELVGATAMLPDGSKVAALPYGPGGYEAGANPDYRPTSATTNQRRISQMLKKLTAQSDSLEKRQRKWEEIMRERQEKAGAERTPEEEAEVVEGEKDREAEGAEASPAPAKEEAGSGA